MQLSNLAYKFSWQSYWVDLFSCTSGILGRRLVVGMKAQDEGGLKAAEFAKTHSFTKKIKILRLRMGEIGLTFFDPHRSCRVLDWMPFVLILLFFLLGCSPSPCSDESRGALADVLGPSSSESGRNNGRSSLPETVEGGTGCFDMEGWVEYLLAGGLVMMGTDGWLKEDVPLDGLVGCSSSGSSDAEGDESFA